MKIFQEVRNKPIQWGIYIVSLLGLYGFYLWLRVIVDLMINAASDKSSVRDPMDLFIGLSLMIVSMFVVSALAFFRDRDSEVEETLYYGTEEQEILDQDGWETVNRILDDSFIEDIHFPIVVMEFRPMKVTLKRDSVLDEVLCTLDGNYGNPYGDSTEPTDQMKSAAEAFCEVMCREYVSWQCEPTGRAIKYSKEEVIKDFDVTYKEKI